MSTTSLIILVALGAWTLQIVTGWWQITRFNRAFDELAKAGRVGIGRSGGRFQPKVVLAIALDPQDKVIRAFVIRGYTVLAAPKELPQLTGVALQDIVPAQLFPNDMACQKALAIAIEPKR